MSRVNRVTLFKIADNAYVPTLLEKLRTLKQDAQRDGHPFLQRAIAGQTAEDPRNQGYNVCLTVAFGNRDDMEYYDTDCPAHNKLKAMLKGKVAGPPLVVYMEDVVGE